eukprot:jgi/Bigna1/82896/fgenesh1_pg.99_\
MPFGDPFLASWMHLKHTAKMHLVACVVLALSRIFLTSGPFAALSPHLDTVVHRDVTMRKVRSAQGSCNCVNRMAFEGGDDCHKVKVLLGMPSGSKDHASLNPVVMVCSCLEITKQEHHTHDPQEHNPMDHTFVVCFTPATTFPAFAETLPSLEGMKMEEDAFFVPDKAPIIAIRSTDFTPTTTSPAQWRHCLETGTKFEEDTSILMGFIQGESWMQIRKGFVWHPILRWPAQSVNRNVVQGGEKPPSQPKNPPPSTNSANATLNLECRSMHPSHGHRVTGGWGDKSVHPTSDQECGSGAGVTGVWGDMSVHPTGVQELNAPPPITASRAASANEGGNGKEAMLVQAGIASASQCMSQHVFAASVASLSCMAPCPNKLGPRQNQLEALRFALCKHHDLRTGTTSSREGNFVQKKEATSLLDHTTSKALHDTCKARNAVPRAENNEDSPLV